MIPEFERDALVKAYGEKLIILFRKEFDERLAVAVRNEVKRQLDTLFRDFSRLLSDQKESK